MNNAYIHGIGIATPGLPEWTTARCVLCGETPYHAESLPPFRTACLPRNEARRMGAAVKLAFRAAEQACDADKAADVATVFVSVTGDIGIADRNSTAVTTAPRSVSPTHFHNSVHNAAAGYWSIATGSRMPANSISGGRDSFAVGLTEAWSTLAVDGDPVLLVCFDAVGKGMLQDAWRDIHDSFACALLLSQQEQGALGCLSRPQVTPAAATAMADPALERFRQCNPAARSLPLLAALAQEGMHSLVIESGQGNLAFELQC